MRTAQDGHDFMDLELLKRFCSTDPMREVLSEPFTIGDYTYATDGRIILRVPKCEQFGGPKPGFLNSERCVSYFATESGQYDSLPAKPAEGFGKPCDDCNSTGRVDHVNCDTCGESKFLGTTIECPSCEGTCRQTWDVAVEFHGQHINAFYLEKLYLLPNATLAPSADPMGVMCFRFDGGEGRLMPMKQP